MENKWEYDYSGLYGRPGDTSSYSTDSACGYNADGSQPGSGGAVPPTNGTAAPTYTAPEPAAPKKHKGAWKKWGTRLVAGVLVAAIGFGSGYAGAKVAGTGTPSVVYQTVERSADATSDSGTVAPQGTALSLTEVAGMVSDSVVAITTEAMATSSYWFGGQYVVSGAGSGVIMTEDGYILTNNHVVSDATNIKVTLADEQTEYTATLIGADSQSDIAVLKIDASGLTPAVMGDSDTLAAGETVVAVGNPLGTLSGTITSGIISALNRDVTIDNNTMSLIQMDASVSPGNSGGGLFDAKGNLVGIVNAKSSGSYAEGLGFAIPINKAMEVAQSLIDNGYVTGRPALGITVITINDANTAAQYGVSGFGVYVASVTAGGAAEQAGMQVGDRIVSIDDAVVEDTGSLLAAIQEKAVGDVVTMQVSREGKLYSVEVTLGESGSATAAAPAAESNDGQAAPEDSLQEGLEEFFNQLPGTQGGTGRQG